MSTTIAEEEGLCKALEYRGLDPKAFNIDMLTRALLKRRMTEYNLRELYRKIEACLMPPRCTMFHCEKHCAGRCMDGHVPGHCGKHRAFRRRCRERKGKVANGPRVGDKLCCGIRDVKVTAVDGDKVVGESIIYGYRTGENETETLEWSREEWVTLAYKKDARLMRGGRQV